MRRARGFTLTELMVYMALVTTGLAVFGSIEMGARRSVGLQSALIDLQSASDLTLAAFRRDVEAAKSLQVGADRLEVVRLDGTRVVYDAKERVEQDAKGKELQRTPVGAESLTFERSAGQVRAKLTLKRTFSWRDSLTRSYERVARPRATP